MGNPRGRQKKGKQPDETKKPSRDTRSTADKTRVLSKGWEYLVANDDFRRGFWAATAMETYADEVYNHMIPEELRDECVILVEPVTEKKFISGYFRKAFSWLKALGKENPDWLCGRYDQGCTNKIFFLLFCKGVFNKFHTFVGKQPSPIYGRLQKHIDNVTFDSIGKLKTFKDYLDYLADAAGEERLRELSQLFHSPDDNDSSAASSMDGSSSGSEEKVPEPGYTPRSGLRRYVPRVPQHGIHVLEVERSDDPTTNQPSGSGGNYIRDFAVSADKQSKARLEKENADTSKRGAYVSGLYSAVSCVDSSKEGNRVARKKRKTSKSADASQSDDASQSGSEGGTAYFQSDDPTSSPAEQTGKRRYNEMKFATKVKSKLGPPSNVKILEKRKVRVETEQARLMAETDAYGDRDRATGRARLPTNNKSGDGGTNVSSGRRKRRRYTQKSKAENTSLSHNDSEDNSIHGGKRVARKKRKMSRSAEFQNPGDDGGINGGQSEEARNTSRGQQAAQSEENRQGEKVIGTDDDEDNDDDAITLLTQEDVEADARADVNRTSRPDDPHVPRAIWEKWMKDFLFKHELLDVSPEDNKHQNRKHQNRKNQNHNNKNPFHNLANQLYSDLSAEERELLCLEPSDGDEELWQQKFVESYLCPPLRWLQDMLTHKYIVTGCQHYETGTNKMLVLQFSMALINSFDTLFDGYATKELKLMQQYLNDNEVTLQSLEGITLYSPQDFVDHLTKKVGIGKKIHSLAALITSSQEVSHETEQPGDDGCVSGGGESEEGQQGGKHEGPDEDVDDEDGGGGGALFTEEEEGMEAVGSNDAEQTNHNEHAHTVVAPEDNGDQEEEEEMEAGERTEIEQFIHEIKMCDHRAAHLSADAAALEELMDFVMSHRN